MPAPGVATGPRIYINNHAAAAQQQAMASEANAQSYSSQHREPFTEQQLHAAWKKYIDSHPHEQVVITAMRQSLPQRIDDTTYKMLVGTAAEETVVKGVISPLLAFLRHEVANDMLALEVELKPTEISRHVMTEREVIDDLKQRNPQVLQLIKDFDLFLA